jgi:hypothetical protein
MIFKCLLYSGVYESNFFHRLLYFSHKMANVIHICAPHSLDNWFLIEDIIAMHDTYKIIRKMDDNISSFQVPVLCHEGDTILQDEVM